MRADNEFLVALVSKLQDIADDTNDDSTKFELEDFIQSIVDSL